MRVVFFLQGDRVPAARARGFAIAARLERDAGIPCALRVARPSVYGDTRLPSPLAAARPLWAALTFVTRLPQLLDLAPSDVVFLQRPMIELPTVVLERLAARGRRTVFDFDDAIHLHLLRGRRVRPLVELADRVIVGNRTLAEVAGAPEKTVIIPTAVDTARFRFLPARETRGRDVVVGWTGLASNYPQLAHALPGLGRALRRTGARLLLVSDAPPPPELGALGPEFHLWNPASEIDILSRIDIGIMPLPDTPFARGKCAYKLIQYMALGRPGVASPVGVNREVITDGVNGFLAASDAAWEEALVRLIEEPALRADMGRRARARVEETYALDAVVPRYVEVLRPLLS